MGYLCYIFVILVGGMLGGVIYSLTTTESHQLRLPFYRKLSKCIDLEMGFFGHMFIGAFAGLILVSLAISHLNFPVEAAVGPDAFPFGSPKPLGRGGMLVVLHTLAISIIGGFLGLKLIIKIADETYRELNSKIGSLAGRLQDKDKADVAYRHATFARALRAEGDLVAAESEIHKSLEILETKFGQFVLALILRKKREFKSAIAALDRAFKLPPDTFHQNDSSIFWNKACYLAISEPSRLTDIMWNLDRSLEINANFKDDIKTDADLRPLLDNTEFKEHYKL